MCVSWAGLEAKALSEKPLRRCSHHSVLIRLNVGYVAFFSAAQRHLVDRVAIENEDCYMAETMHKTYVRAAVSTICCWMYIDVFPQWHRFTCFVIVLSTLAVM